MSQTNRQEIHRRVGQRWELVESYGLDEAGWRPILVRHPSRHHG